MDRNKLILKLAGLDNREWLTITQQMGWYFRRNGEGRVPTVVKVLINEDPQKATWDALCMEVNLLRRNARAKQVRQLRAAQREARRDYMRTYMRKYRAEVSV